jgi:hypothetical protein
VNQPLALAGILLGLLAIILLVVTMQGDRSLLVIVLPQLAVAIELGLRARRRARK